MKNFKFSLPKCGSLVWIFLFLIFISIDIATGRIGYTTIANAFILGVEMACRFTSFFKDE